MTKKEFLKELEKRFSMVGDVFEHHQKYGEPHVGRHEVTWHEVPVMDTKGILRADRLLSFWIEDEDGPDERAYTPHLEEDKLERFEERFGKKCESIQIAREQGLTKKELLKELKKKFSEVSGTLLDRQSGGIGNQKINEYEVKVTDTKGNLCAHTLILFFVEDEGAPAEKAYTPHPEEDKLKRFEERFRKKVESFQLS